MSSEACCPAPVTPGAVRAAAESIGLHPSKSLGQNFLIDRNVRDCIVKAAVPEPACGILEIGPGLGALTEVLAERSPRLVAVEKDYRLAGRLREVFAGNPRVDIRCADALEVDLRETMAGIDTVVSNLPYSSGTRILVRLIQYAGRPERLAVTVQLEVAERMVSPPGRGDYGLLAVWVQRDYSVTIERRIAPTCFWPVPEVKSALVTLSRLAGSASGDDTQVRETFYAITRQAFQHRRKRLARALSAGRGGCEAVAEALRSAGIDPDARPEMLSKDDWWGLAAVFAGLGCTA